MALKPHVGSPLKQKPLGKAKALSCEHLALTSQAESIQVPFSPFLRQRLADLLDSLKGLDSEMEEPEERVIKCGRVLHNPRIKNEMVQGTALFL